MGKITSWTDLSVRTDPFEVKTTRTEVASSILKFIGRTFEVGAAADTSLPIWQIIRESVQGNQTIRDIVGKNTFNQIFDNRATAFPAIPFSNLFSINFDQVNDFVNVPDALNLQFDRLEAFSVSFWAKSIVTVFQVYVTKRDATTSEGWKIRRDSNPVLNFLFQDTGGGFIEVQMTSNNAILEGGAWHHVAITYDGSGNASGVSIYINAVNQALTIVNDNLTTSTITTDPLRIGADENLANHFGGNMDEISIWDTELSSAQVTEAYNSGTPDNLATHSASTALVSWWRMGDNDIFPVIKDNQDFNDGTMTNMTSNDIQMDTPP